MRSVAVALVLKPFRSHHACIAASYAALPSVVFGYGLHWSQFVNGPFATSLIFLCGVVSAPGAGEVDGPRFVPGVVWNGFVGLPCGLLSTRSLFWVGVCGVSSGLTYMGGGVLGSLVWGTGGQFWAD